MAPNEGWRAKAAFLHARLWSAGDAEKTPLLPNDRDRLPFTEPCLVPHSPPTHLDLSLSPSQLLCPSSAFLRLLSGANWLCFAPTLSSPNKSFSFLCLPVSLAPPADLSHPEVTCEVFAHLQACDGGYGISALTSLKAA